MFRFRSVSGQIILGHARQVLDWLSVSIRSIGQFRWVMILGCFFGFIRFLVLDHSVHGTKIWARFIVVFYKFDWLGFS